MEFQNEIKETENGAEEIYEEIMAENFPKLTTNTKSQIQKTQQTPNWINTQTKHTHTSHHSTHTRAHTHTHTHTHMAYHIKITENKNKGKILKAVREKHYKGRKIKVTGDFSYFL